MAECFDPDNVGCAYTASCTLKGVLSAATAAYLKVLDGVTLADMLVNVKTGERPDAGSPVIFYPREPVTL